MRDAPRRQNEIKIRTDFVTNSSSSSFTVSIDIRTVDGKTYRAKVEPDDGGGNGNADICCSAESLLNCPSVASLMDAIYDAVTVTVSPWVDAEESKLYFAEGVRKLAARVKKNIHSLDQIATLTFRRLWYAWGECASCFGINIDVYAPELSALARRLREAEEDNADEEELEALKEEMRFYIRYYEVQLRPTTIREAWESEAFERFRNRMRGACPGCDKKELCMGGCPLMPEIVFCDSDKRYVKAEEQ